MNTIFTYIFVAEIIIKVIANGLILNGHNSYFKVPWNILGFL